MPWTARAVGSPNPQTPAREKEARQIYVRKIMGPLCFFVPKRRSSMLQKQQQFDTKVPSNRIPACQQAWLRATNTTERDVQPNSEAHT